MGGTLPQTDAERACRLHTLLRVLLVGLPRDTSATDLASALMYEVASITACLAEDEREACAAMEAMADVACAQIRTFGVGRMHPV